MPRTVVLTQDRYKAIHTHLFETERRELESTPGPWVEVEAPSDTEAHLPAYQRSYYLEKAGGTGWPARFIVWTVTQNKARAT